MASNNVTSAATGPTKSGKLESPPAKDQAAGVKSSGPHNHYEEDLIQLFHNASISAATKLES